MRAVAVNNGGIRQRLVELAQAVAQGRPAASRIIAAVLTYLTLACTSTESRLPTGTPPDTTNGGVQRTTLTVQVVRSVADSAVAQALGWPLLAVPGVTVVLRSEGSTQQTTLVTDASGSVTFTGLLQGLYSVSALRPVSATERTLLPATYQEVDALGGSRVASLGTTPTSIDVQLLATQRGTLVISEIWSGEPLIGNSFYNYGDFLEVYNNSDTPVNLAGKLVVEGFPGTYDNPDLNSCALHAPFQRDSAGIWATMIYAFPAGAPTLPPGGVALLATDAIDHTTVTALAYNLSQADFEFRGQADVDNPQVLDMVSVGPSDGGGITGRGLSYYSSQPAIALADQIDLGTLPQQQLSGRTYLRLPTSGILDVITWGRINPSFPSCGSPLHPSLDAEQARLITDWSADLRSITRRQISTLPSGRALVLRTRSSALDFIAAQPTPGRVP